MSRLTFAGAIFLTVVAILPMVLTRLINVPPTAAQFFGGTGLLIMVGVLLDVMRQVETHLIQRAKTAKLLGSITDLKNRF